MKKLFYHLLPVFILAVAIIISVTAITQAQISSITYPVPELNNCKDEASCKSYCNNPDNISQCVTFAENHNLMSEKEVRKARAFINAGQVGPGGCRGHNECEAYCSKADNIIKCVAFAEENGLMDEDELKDALKVRNYLKDGGKLPLGCTDVITCKQICEKPERLEVARSCFEFAKAAGLLPEDVNPERAEAAFKLIEEGTIASFEELKKCDNPDAFANHTVRDKCIKAGVAMGFIKAEEVEFIKATGGKGPGGCRGRECETFCDNKNNQEICANFITKLVEENPDLNIEDIITETDQNRMQEGLIRMRQGLSQAPPEVKTCIEDSLPGLVTKIESDNFTPIDMIRLGRRIDQVMKSCFEKAFAGTPEIPGGPGHEGPGGNFVEECFQKLGIDRTKPPPIDVREKVESCVQEKIAAEGKFPGGPAQGINVKIDKGPTGTKWKIQAPGGIREFSANPPSGPPYSGGLSGCPKQDERNVPITPPFNLTVKTCDNNAFEFKVDAFGIFSKGAPTGVPGRREFPADGYRKFPNQPTSFPNRIIPNLSPEVADCARELNITFTGPPTLNQESRIKKCVEEKTHSYNRQGEHPPELLNCIREEGSDELVRLFQTGDQNMTPEESKIVGRCIEDDNFDDRERVEIRERERSEYEREDFEKRNDSPAHTPDSFPPEMLQRPEELRKQFSKEIPAYILKQFESGNVPEEFLEKLRMREEPRSPEPPQSNYDSKKECEVRGGKWNTDINYCQTASPSPSADSPPTPNPKTECEKRGGIWENNACISDPVVICEKQGGRWDKEENTCKLAQFTPPSILDFIANLLGIIN